jgi:hypothetical protein
LATRKSFYLMIVMGYAIASCFGLLAGWLIRHFLKTPGFKSDTTRFFKKSGSNIRFYTTPTLIGTILVAIAVLNVAFDEVTKFMMMEDKGQVISQRLYELFRIKVGLAALTTWYAFINPAWQQARKQQQDANAKLPMPPEPTGSTEGRLKTLG